MTVEVRNNDINKALLVLKQRMETEGIFIEADSLNAIVRGHGGDLRNAINALQAWFVLPDENARENFIVVVSNSNSSNTFQNAADSTGKPSDNTILLSNGMYFDLGAVNSSGSLIRPITISGGGDDASRAT